MDKWPIGVFASIDAGLGVKLDVAHELGVPTIQLHAPARGSRTPADAPAISGRRWPTWAFRLTAVFGGFEGESYADIPTVVRTVGLVPPATRAARTKEMKEIADFARLLDVDVVALHLGFVPHDPADPLYGEVLAVTRDLCDHCREQSARTCTWKPARSRPTACCDSSHDVERDNLFINFDPANMILYGSGEPIAALEKLGRYVRSVHCKDATWAAHPGQEWGAKCRWAQGDVGMENFLRTLDAIGYHGPLTIEREIPQEPERQKAEIGQAIRSAQPAQSQNRLKFGLRQLPGWQGGRRSRLTRPPPGS